MNTQIYKKRRDNIEKEVENIDTKQIDKNQLLAKFNNNVNRLKKVHPKRACGLEKNL